MSLLYAFSTMARIAGLHGTGAFMKLFVTLILGNGFTDIPSRVVNNCYIFIHTFKTPNKIDL